MTPEQKREACRKLYVELGVDEVYRRLSAKEEANTDLIDSIWKSYPDIGRKRSTRYKAAQALKRIPKTKRPSESEMLHAVKLWSRSEGWKQGFVPGLHTWIKDRAWLDAPSPEKVVRFTPRPLENHPDLAPNTDFDSPRQAAEFLNDILNQAAK